MRGEDQRQSAMFSYISLEQRVPEVYWFTVNETAGWHRNRDMAG
jgi:hypothetical protein